MKTIELHSLVDVQNMMEAYDLSEFSSIPQLLVELFQTCARRDIPSISLNIHQSILPEYYSQSPWHLKHQLKDQIQYPHVSIHKRYRGEWVYIQVSTQPHTQIFKQRLLSAAQSGSHRPIMFPIHEIPESYQINPFVVLSRLNKQHNLNIKLKARTRTHYIYAIQP